MSTIPQNNELLKQLFIILEAHRHIFRQQRIYERIQALLFAELFTFSRHTITQLLMSLGQTEYDWSAWYRLFSQGRFCYDKACEVLFRLIITHIPEEATLILGGDGTQTPRSGRKLEGAGWLRCPRNPVFKVSIHTAQRWFNGSIFLPDEKGYTRALPIRWLPAFTPKSKPTVHDPCTEGEAAVQFLLWVLEQLQACGRMAQKLLFVGDGRYDTVKLWRELPAGVIMLARSAKNRALFYLPPPGSHANRKYGKRAPTPQQLWATRKGWRKLTLHVRNRDRHLQYKVCGPFVRKGAPDRPLMLIIVRGKHNKKTRRIPLPFLVNAVQHESGEWVLPLPVETLLFWAWQRWELEVCHREIKSNFGLGQKQCWNPTAAVLAIQWSAWVYSVLLLAGYRTWGLTGAPPVPTSWWPGAPRWSLNTLWRAYRAALWGQHDFYALCTPTPCNWAGKEQSLLALRNAVFASARS